MTKYSVVALRPDGELFGSARVDDLRSAAMEFERLTRELVAHIDGEVSSVNGAFDIALALGVRDKLLSGQLPAIDAVLTVGNGGEVRVWGVLAEPPIHEKPCAAVGLCSYRYRGPYGWIMAGAVDHFDAEREVKRSLTSGHFEKTKLEVWDGTQYVRALDCDNPPKKEA